MQIKVAPRGLVATSSSKRQMAENIEITVGDTEYLLIPHSDDFLSDVGAASDPESVVLVLVYPTVPGQAITKSDLRNFQTNVLDRDDVFQPEFASNLVFVGAREGELRIEPGALDELANGQVKSKTYIDAGPSLHVAPGPYVFT